jgi:hypothetical protein
MNNIKIDLKENILEEGKWVDKLKIMSSGGVLYQQR